MRVCSLCEKENPSSAKYCLSCGNSFSNETDKKNESLDKINEEKSNINDYEIQSQLIFYKTQSDALNAELLDLKEKQQKELNDKELKLKELIERSFENKKISNGNWGWFFVFLFGLTLLLVYYFYSKHQENQNTIYDLNFEKEKIKNDNLNTYRLKNELIDSLQNANSVIELELLLLRQAQPKLYKVNVIKAYSYSMCAGSFYPTDCYYNYASLVNVYSVRDEYGLTLGGWILLSDLEIIEEGN